MRRYICHVTFQVGDLLVIVWAGSEEEALRQIDNKLKGFRKVTVDLLTGHEMAKIQRITNNHKIGMK